MLFPITSAVAVTCFAWALKRFGRRSALAIVLGAWVFALVLVVVPLLYYTVDYSLEADVLVALSLASATLAYSVVRRRPRQIADEPAVNRNVAHFVSEASLVVGLTGCLLFLVDGYIQGLPLSITGLLNSLSDIRAAAMDTTQQDLRSERATFILGGYLTAFSYIGMAAALWLGPVPGRRRLGPLVVANLIGIAAVSLLVFGGRTILINGVLLLAVSVLLSERSISIKNPKIVLAVTLALAGAWYFSVTFYEAREGGRIDVDLFLHTLERAELPEWIGPTARNDPAVGLAIVNYGYFASALPALSWYMQQKPRPGPFWGAYSYPLPSRITVKIWGDADSKNWVQVRRQIFGVLESRGYGGNIWATWMRDLLVDFGYFGAILFSALCGGFMAWARNRLESTGAVQYALFEAITCFTFAFGAFQNLMWVNVYSNVLFAAVAFALAVALFSPRRSRATLRGRRHARQYATLAERRS